MNIYALRNLSEYSSPSVKQMESYIVFQAGYRSYQELKLSYQTTIYQNKTDLLDALCEEIYPYGIRSDEEIDRIRWFDIPLEELSDLIYDVVYLGQTKIRDHHCFGWASVVRCYDGKIWQANN